LPLIISEDSLSSNAPHIADLVKHDLHYILGVKEGDHKFLFKYVDAAIETGEFDEFSVADSKKAHIRHTFRYINNVPLNKSNQETLVNFVEYWQEDTKTGKTLRFSWITDFTITAQNVFQIMRGGRARWKIENETFNTLKNQGYNLGHNYGLGKKNLSTIFVLLMMLAFLVDQALQLCCALFNAVWKKEKSKRQLWEDLRSFFRFFNFESMEAFYCAILYDLKVDLPDI
jgi:hypothetical protein